MMLMHMHVNTLVIHALRCIMLDPLPAPDGVNDAAFGVM